MTDEQLLAELVTPNAAATIRRLVKDHGVSVRDVIRAAVEQATYWIEEDIAEDGGMSGGECEWGFIGDCIRLSRRNEAWTCYSPEKKTMKRAGHNIGAVSFFEAFGDRIPRLRKDFGPMPRLKKAA